MKDGVTAQNGIPPQEILKPFTYFTREALNDQRSRVIKYEAFQLLGVANKYPSTYFYSE